MPHDPQSEPMLTTSKKTRLTWSTPISSDRFLTVKIFSTPRPPRGCAWIQIACPYPQGHAMKLAVSPGSRVARAQYARVGVHCQRTPPVCMEPTLFCPELLPAFVHICVAVHPGFGHLAVLHVKNESRRAGDRLPTSLGSTVHQCNDVLIVR